LLLAMTLGGCARTQQDPVAEIYPEEREPHFKTCIERNGGTYQERKLHTFLIRDIYQDPAPDKGPITEECIVRE
jgi:hypothetical protein